MYRDLGFNKVFTGSRTWLLSLRYLYLSDWGGDMIKRDVSRDEISKLVHDRFFAGSFDEQLALVDMVMDQISMVEPELLTVSKIKSIVEQEVFVWKRVQQ